MPFQRFNCSSDVCYIVVWGVEYTWYHPSHVVWMLSSRSGGANEVWRPVLAEKLSLVLIVLP